MRKILVPTDLSDIAELGLKLACEISKRTKAPISLVNFTQHPFGKTFSVTGDVTLNHNDEENTYALQLLKANKQKLEELVAKYQLPDVAMEFAIVDNVFREGLDDYLKSEQFDLIVMGTSGEETAKEAFTGNHTEQAIRISSCPVLSVRDGFRIQDFDNIVVAVDVITDNQLANGLELINQLASCFGSTIHLVHVRDHATDTNIVLDEYFTHMAEIANLQNFKVVILDGESREKAILQYASEVRAGLVAVVKNRKDGIFRIFSNHLSDRIVKDEGRPVITVNLHNVSS